MSGLHAFFQQAIPEQYVEHKQYQTEHAHDLEARALARHQAAQEAKRRPRLPKGKGADLASSSVCHLTAVPSAGQRHTKQPPASQSRAESTLIGGSQS